jgi:hypothetical protein
MSSDLEKFIRKNRHSFDEADPSNANWEKIAKTIPVKKDAKRFTIKDVYKWSAAAAVFFVIITSAYFLFVKEYSHENPSTKSENEKEPYQFENFNIISMEYAAELKKVSSAVEDRQKELKVAVANDPELYKKFQADLSILDSTYKMLREQANQSVNRDVIIKAMIQNLQLQSELLGRQLMIIKEFKPTKSSSNEKNI